MLGPAFHGQVCRAQDHVRVSVVRDYCAAAVGRLADLHEDVSVLVDDLELLRPHDVGNALSAAPDVDSGLGAGEKQRRCGEHGHGFRASCGKTIASSKPEATTKNNSRAMRTRRTSRSTCAILSSISVRIAPLAHYSRARSRPVRGTCGCAVPILAGRA
jgi:hypothetical protein